MPSSRYPQDERFEQFEAVFQPRRLDDLRPGAEDWIGRTCTWMRSWIIEEDEGEYAGQWACTLESPKPSPFVWAPESDLQRVHHDAE